MSTLYELTGELLELQQMLESEEIDETVLKDTLEAVNGEFSAKLEGCGFIIRNLEAEYEQLKGESERLKARADSRKKRIDWLRSQIMQAMVASGKQTEKGLHFTWTVKDNPGKTIVDHPENIPFGYFKEVDPVPDLTKIKNFLMSEEGKNCDWAHIEVGQSLQMK